MVSWSSLASELVGTVPGLSPILAETYINRAWEAIQNSRNWSFLVKETAVVCPAQVTAGRVSITRFAATVTCDATASAALLAVTTPPGLTNMQMRFNGTGRTGEVYSITAVDQSTPSAVVLTLDRIVQEPTNAASLYQCYRCYIQPPSNERFLRWISMADMINGLTVRLDQQYKFFDQRDPQRMAQGLAYYCGSYKTITDVVGFPRFELWPHPTSGQTFVSLYRVKNAAFADPDESQPYIIDDEAIVTRAQWAYAYPWALANQGRFPALQKTNWNTAINQSKQQYTDLMIRLKRQDDEIYDQRMLRMGHKSRLARPIGFAGPIDANFIQSHPITW